MINKYIFNKRKKNIIILLHGLYTTAGFWLSYLNLFENFKIVAFDINYNLLLKEQNPELYLQEYINEFWENENIVAIISHSFGTVISDLAFIKKDFAIFKICPVAFSIRIDSQSFIKDIEKKTLLPKENIYEYIDLVRNFLSKFKQQLNLNGSIYIPDYNGFFTYEIPLSKKNQFIGNHFNISLALSEIITSLTNCSSEPNYYTNPGNIKSISKSNG